MLCEDGKDAHGVCVDGASFVTDHGGAAADSVVVEDGSVHNFSYGVEVAAECGFAQNLLCSFPVVSNVFQFLDCGRDLFCDLLLPLLDCLRVFWEIVEDVLCLLVMGVWEGDLVGQVGQIFSCGFTGDVVRLSSYVLHCLGGVIEFLKLLGGFPVEEVSFDGWFSWAGVEQDLVGCP